jgi:hypothetical protein
MALTSPGVEVTIIDQSQYLPAPTNSVPLVVVATAQNKADASGTGVAQATTLANANKLFLVTSQRDLVNLYGTPFFYTTTNGTPIQGYELNEYGLLAAYSVLGATNRCYVLRADIDLAALVGQTGRPTGAPEDGAYWLDTTNTTWGIFEFNATTGKFTQPTPIVITDSDLLTNGVPLPTVGNIGDYAVNAIQITASPSQAVQYFYKVQVGVGDSEWVALGSGEWKAAWPTIQGTESDPALTENDTFVMDVGGLLNITITVGASPNNTVEGIAAQINALGYYDIEAKVVDEKLAIYSKQQGESNNNYIEIVSSTGTVLEDLGIETGTYLQPAFYYGTAAQMPLWTSSQTNPRPTGSVWLKVGSAGQGLAPVVARYDATIGTWLNKSVTLATADWVATSGLDATGGKAIPQGTIYAQYNFDDSNLTPVYLWERIATGPTVVTASVNNPSFSAGSFRVKVSIPNSSSLTSWYTVSLSNGDDALDFKDKWQNANIPNTSVEVTNSGAIQLIHTQGGEIILNDYDAMTGVSNGIIEAAGFIVGTTLGCKFGPFNSTTYEAPQPSVSIPGVGNDLIVEVTTSYGTYQVSPVPIDGGNGYTEGNTITIPGTSLGGTSPTNDLVVKVIAVTGGVVTELAFVSGVASSEYTTQLSNWVEFSYTANEGEPNNPPSNNTNWFYSVVDQVDIMVNYNGNWRGYRNQNYDSTGFPTPTGTNTTDANGPIVSATEPTEQSDGTALVYGDLWINTSDLENYPVISRWENVDGEDQWVLINNTDQISSNGIVFSDARWATNGTTSPVNDPIPSIQSLLTSNYLDIDAPNPVLYPTGMLLFNTRRSGYNIKQFRSNYFNGISFPGQSLPVQKDAWVSVSGLQSNGAPFMGRKAQRNMVVQSMRQAIDTNTDIRDEDNFFNLIATPNYPELQPNMIVLNADRGETAYIIGDTPMGLADDATAIQAWANNAAGATSTGEEGLVSRNTYMGLFYPSGIAPDLNGNLVAVPPSHMMLRTFLRNDTIAYPWLAAAGTRRGIIDNATNIGYLNRTTGEFITIKTRIGIRDVLYINFINPLVFFTGVGLLNYGNKTSFDSQSALDRTNVARLVAYIRRQLTLASRPFVFEPNDPLTRNEISGVIETLLIDLVAKRGIYDYLVVCDETNNTPARIDRNELWVDVAIEPVKAAEFIYIPVRVLNTGELSA